MGSIILVASTIIVKLIGALFRIPLAKALGGTGMGYFSAAYSVYLPVYAITSAGIPAAVARLTARESSKNVNSLNDIKSVSILIFTLIGLIGTAFIFITAKFFSKNIINNEGAYLSIMMISPAVLFGCPCAALRGFYEGRQNMIPTALSQMTEALVKLAAGLSGVYLVINKSSLYNLKNNLPYYTAAAAALGITFSVFSGLIFMIIYDLLSKKTKTKATGNSNLSKKQIIKNLMDVAVPGAFCSLVTSISSLVDLLTMMNSLETAVKADYSQFSYLNMDITQIPNFMYGCFSGLAVTVFNLVPSVTNMFGRGSLPAVTMAYKDGNMSKFRSNTEDLIFTVSFIALPCSLGLGVLSKEILSLLFSQSTAEVALASRPLAVMCPAIFLLSLSSSLFPVFQAADRQDIPVKLMIIATIFKAIGNIVLVRMPKLNISGGALSTTISYLVLFIGTMYYLGKLSKIDVFDIFRTEFLLIIAAVLCAMGARLIYETLENYINSSLCTVLSVISGGIIYIIVTIFEGIFSKSTLKMLICEKNQKNT